jgi:hypothetical protein
MTKREIEDFPGLEVQLELESSQLFDGKES